MRNEKIKYCALTTISNSLKAFVLPLLKELKKQGYNIHVSCANDEKFAELVKEEFVYFPLNIERGFNLFKTLKNIFVLWKYFRKEKFQMIEYGTENAALCAAIAGFFARVPVRIYNHWGARYVGLSGISRILSKWIERLAAFFSTDIRQVSHRNAKMCVEAKIYPERKVKVLGRGGTIGVDFSIFDQNKKEQYIKEVRTQYNIPGDSFVYGYVGRIQTDKGINELISAFEKIYEDNKNVYLMLVGSFDSQNSIEKNRLEWVQTCPNVICTGLVSDTYRYMSFFDVLVHPTYREGFGMVLQEAAAVKTPIITTDIMGPGEFIKHNLTGLLVRPKDVEELHGAMQIIIKDKKKREEFSEKCYEYTKNYFERTVMVSRLVNDREELKNKILNNRME